MKLDTKQLKALKAIKHNPEDLKMINLSMFNVIYAIYQDLFMDSEMARTKAMLKFGFKEGKFKNLFNEYNIFKESDIKDDSLEAMAKELVEQNLISLTEEFFKRTFEKHLSMAIFSQHNADKTYVETVLGVELAASTIERYKQVDYLKKKYAEITPTFDCEVGF